MNFVKLGVREHFTDSRRVGLRWCFQSWQRWQAGCWRNICSTDSVWPITFSPSTKTSIISFPYPESCRMRDFCIANLIRARKFCVLVFFWDDLGNSCVILRHPWSSNGRSSFSDTALPELSNELEILQLKRLRDYSTRRRISATLAMATDEPAATYPSQLWLISFSPRPQLQD